MQIPVTDGAQQNSALADSGKTYEVTDLVFASALMACGVPLAKAPSLVRFGNQKRAIFHFKEMDPDRLVSVPKSAYAVRDPMKFMVDNPLNPLSFALAAITTYFDMLRRFTEGRAMVAMQAGKGAGPTLWFAEGSRLHRAAIKRGMEPLTKPIEPTALEKLCQLPVTTPPTTKP